MISDLAYADLAFDGKPAPSIFQVKGARDVAVEFFTVSKSYSMPGWRVGFCVGNDALVGSLTTIKGYLDYGIFAPTQLAAATALATCDADVEENRARYRHRAEVLVKGLAAAGWPVEMPTASMFVWAPLPAAHRHRTRGRLRVGAAVRSAGRGLARASGSAPAARGSCASRWSSPTTAPPPACAAIGEFLASPSPEPVPTP